MLISVLAPVTGCFMPDETVQKQVSFSTCTAPDDESERVDQLLQLINLARVEYEVAPVALNQRLSKLAGDYACRMVAEDFFDHRDPLTGYGPGDRAAAAKYTFYAVGENLAAGHESPVDVMKVWMESPSHREIMLDPRWKEVGLAVRAGGDYGVYWVQEFGDPAVRSSEP